MLAGGCVFDGSGLEGTAGSGPGSLLPVAPGALGVSDAGIGPLSDGSRAPGRTDPRAAGDASAAPTRSASSITICHRPGRKPPGKTMQVERGALTGHLKHGDRLGACPSH